MRASRGVRWQDWVGLGIKLAGKTAPYRVERLLAAPGGGSEAEGQPLAGDTILAVDGVSLRSLKLTEVGALLRGPAHSCARLTVSRPKMMTQRDAAGSATILELALARTQVQQQQAFKDDLMGAEHVPLPLESAGYVAFPQGEQESRGSASEHLQPMGGPSDVAQGELWDAPLSPVFVDSRELDEVIAHVSAQEQFVDEQVLGQEMLVPSIAEQVRTFSQVLRKRLCVRACYPHHEVGMLLSNRVAAGPSPLLFVLKEIGDERVSSDCSERWLGKTCEML